jgi:hypothetical protein
MKVKVSQAQELKNALKSISDNRKAKVKEGKKKSPFFKGGF